MAFRVTFKFQQVGDLTAGWSMNFWNGLADLSQVVTVATTLRLKLQQMTGKGCNVVSIRISDLDNFRAVQFIRFKPTSVASGDNTGDADFYNTAALLKIQGPPKYVTTQWFRGLGDENFNTGGRWLPTPSTVNSINALSGMLSAGGNGWRIRNQDKDVVKKLITSVTLPGVVTVTGHGYATGSKVRISRTGGIPGLNKIWSIVVVDSNTFQLVAPPSGGFTGAYTKEGTAQLQTKIYQAISLLTVARASSHRSGRPSETATGRAKTR